MKTKEMQIIGSYIEEARTKVNMTQSELAQQIGISSCNMHKIEKGKRFPSYRLSLKICDVLNIDKIAFLRGLKYLKFGNDIRLVAEKINLLYPSQDIYLKKENISEEILYKNACNALIFAI